MASFWNAPLFDPVTRGLIQGQLERMGMASVGVGAEVGGEPYNGGQGL